jgi:di/tricarboxylate transporter
MDGPAWITLAVLAIVLVGIAREVGGPDLWMVGGLLALGLLGVLQPKEAFAGFANPVLPAIGGLLVVSAALRETGLMERLFAPVLMGVRGEAGAVRRLAPVLAAGSAFLNNVTLVALATPLVRDWTRRRGLSHSRMLIPLDYATILGSVTTLIGTSTTLVVAALIVDGGLEPMRFFELAPVGIPLCIAGLIYLSAIAPRVLPDRRDPADEVGDHRREYTATMIVAEGAPLTDRTVEEAGLRHLPGLFLVEIDRGGRVITPVAPDQGLRAGDRLVFAGVVATIVDLQTIPGLVPATEEDTAAPVRGDRRLVEAVVSSSSPLVGRSIRDVSFRTLFDAAVIAVHRNAERMGGKIGEIVLRPGDTLLLQTGPGFLRAHRNSPDFYLVSELAAPSVERRDRAGIAGVILVAMVGVVAAGLLPIAFAAPLAAGALVATRCISGAVARASVSWSILVIIGAGLGFASALEKTGAASAAAQLLVTMAGNLGPLGALAMVYLAALLMAEFLHHTAAAAIVVPVAFATAAQLGVDPRGFVMAVAFGASCSFAIPVSYQTHLIVYGPGGYRFRDFVRVGIPLDLLCAGVALLLIPRIWPF